jgi:hypothetical protein
LKKGGWRKRPLVYGKEFQKEYSSRMTATGNVTTVAIKQHARNGLKPGLQQMDDQ